MGAMLSPAVGQSRARARQVNRLSQQLKDRGLEPQHLCCVHSVKKEVGMKTES